MIANKNQVHQFITLISIYFSHFTNNFKIVCVGLEKWYLTWSNLKRNLKNVKETFEGTEIELNEYIKLEHQLSQDSLT